MNGDIVTDLDFSELMSFHREHESRAHDRDDGEGGADLARRDRARGATCNGLRREADAVLPREHGRLRVRATRARTDAAGHFDFPDVVHLLIEQGEPVVSYPFSGTWFDIGTPSDHERAVEAFGFEEEPHVTEWRVPLADVIVTDDDIAAVVETYRTGWLSMGPRTEELEERFADVHRSAPRGGCRRTGRQRSIWRVSPPGSGPATRWSSPR